MEKEISEREKERKREKKRSRSSLQSKSYIVFNMDNVIEARALTWVHAEFFFFFLLRGRGLEKKIVCFPFHPASFPLNFPVSQVCLPELNFRYSIMAATVLRGKCKNAFHGCFLLLHLESTWNLELAPPDCSTDFSLSLSLSLSLILSLFKKRNG